MLFLLLSQMALADFSLDELEARITKSHSPQEIIKNIKIERKKLKSQLTNYKPGDELPSVLNSKTSTEEILQRLELKKISSKNCKNAKDEISFIDSNSAGSQKSKEALMGLRLLDLICKNTK